MLSFAKLANLQAKDCGIVFGKLLHIKVRGGRGSNLDSTWVRTFLFFCESSNLGSPGFELLEEFELFQGSENSILNLGSIWVLIGFHSIWVEPGLNLG